ncbi:MAG: efflux RND transporter periplasmic adaptor subunit [Legionellales bacterium]|nr:efflux RND transporter periplasmic adaptor subunit [Legionellales bacterium]
MRIQQAILPVAIATFLGGLFVIGCQNDQDSGESSSSLEVTVSHPLKQTIIEWDEYTGRFQAIGRVEIRARVSGYLDQIRFVDGQKVKRGDVLFIIDQRPFVIALNQAQAQYTLATKEYNRAQKLWKSRSISESTVDLKAQEYHTAKANLDQEKLNLAFTLVRSPIDGRVGRHLISPGNLISGDRNNAANATLLTTVVSTNPIHFYFEASERDLLKYIRFDQTTERETLRSQSNPIFVKLQDEQEFTHQGTVDFIDNEVDLETGTIEGRATIPNPNDVIQPGLFGRARISASGEYQAILIPDEIIGSDQSQKFVYIINDDNEIEKRFIQIGPLHDHYWRIIRQGLSANDQVVTKGIQRLRAGMVVSPKLEPLTQQQ